MSGAAASGNEAARATSAGARPSGHRARMTRWLIVFGLLAPALLLYATVYLGGMAIIGLASFGLGPDAESGATLVNYREDQQRLVKLAEQARESSRAAAIARVRYREGAADFLALLDAERTELQAEDAVAEAEAGVFTSVSAGYKALGGIPAS